MVTTRCPCPTPSVGELFVHLGELFCSSRRLVLLISLLLGSEERDREVVVELLVREVNEELLERILLKVLKAVDVEDAEEARRRVRLRVHQRRVHLRDHPAEQLEVHRLVTKC